MKNKVKLITGGIIFYFVVIFVSIYFLLIPGISKISKASSYKELTFEEKSKLIDEINNKYTKLESEINDKYIKLDEEVNNTYDPLIEEVNVKYSNLVSEVENNYKTKESDIVSKINDAKVRQNKEFFKSGFSDKYYSIGEELKSLEKEKDNILKEKNEEIRKLETSKNSEVSPYVIKKNSLIKNNDINKSSELDSLSISKNKEISKIDNQNYTNTVNKIIGVLLSILSIILVVIPIIYVVKVYNKLTKLNNRVDSNWSDIDVLLKQRSDLIPNIVNSVKGYTKHENATLTNVTKAREKVVNASNRKEEIESNNELDNELSSIFLLNEKYPDLKGDKSFNKLIDNLSEIEDKISISRKEYNDSVLKYMNSIEVFPANIVSSLFGFKEEYYFKTSEEEKENVDVKF